MIFEFFRAVLYAGLPVGAATYALIWWIIKKEYLGEVSTLDDMEKEVKRRKKDKNLKKSGDLVHNKWMAFGGGFYGLVGVLTYLVVEVGEIRDFFLRFNGIMDFLSRISVDALIGLIINAFMNFIVAFIWPMYWLSNIQTHYIWIWFLVAYGSYWLAARMALQRFGVKTGEML